MSGIEQNFVFGKRTSTVKFRAYAQRHGSLLDLDSSLSQYINYEINYDDSFADDERTQLEVETSYCSQGVAMLDLNSEDEPDVRLAFTSTQNFMIGIFMLMLMVIPLSIIGPLTIGLPANDVHVKITWRNYGCTLATIPLWILLYVLKGKELNLAHDFQPRILFRNFISAICLFSWTTGLILGCSLTVTSHADIMYSSSGVYILMATLITCQSVHILELVGYFMYFIGVYIMLIDESAFKTGINGHSYLGDMYAFIGAGFWALFSYINRNNNNKLHPLVTLTQISIFSSLMQMAIFPFLVKSPGFFSFDPFNGAFGWLTDSHAFLLVVVNALITGIIGNFGFYWSYYYWPMQIVAGSMLIEPFLAQIAGIMLGQDEIPGVKTLIGCIVISLGFVISGFGTRYKTMNNQKRKDSVYSSQGDYTRLGE